MYKDVTGIILAGGKSSRMDLNKSTLKINGITIIERITKLLKKLFPEVLIVSNETNTYSFLGLPVYEDIFKYKGPLAGIHSGLLHSKCKTNFIISSDLPFITDELIKYIIDYKTDKPVTVSRATGFIQPLAGKYSIDCLPVIEEILNQELIVKIPEFEQKVRQYSVHKFLDLVDTEIISIEDKSFYHEDLYFNMNTIEDYEYVISKLNTSDKYTFNN
jgi:molybdopterin-guanine dinucleotide biosynthesis protein A